jgi:DMSO/TMAO reductase YedYZ molybdopterin-dependent catalytic subunit
VTSPIERFYETRYRSANPRPELSVQDWQLRVEGRVQSPQILTYEAITSLPQVEVLRTLECISNPVGGTLIGNTVWRGIRLADVLALSGVRPDARELKMTAADGYQTSVPLALAQDPDSLLVFEMDGAPLPVKHGYPVRVLLPGHYGQKQPKWIAHMEVIADEFLGYWEARGWSNEARIQINSQIWEPTSLSSVPGEAVTIWGIAFADESGVSRVEISTDDGATWRETTLMPGSTSLVWTEWRYEWTLPVVDQPTLITLAARATDGNGNRQRRRPGESGVLNNTFPDGTSDIHRITVRVEPSS